LGVEDTGVLEVGAEVVDCVGLGGAELELVTVVELLLDLTIGDSTEALLSACLYNI
jgi:hypothetical protein